MRLYWVGKLDIPNQWNQRNWDFTPNDFGRLTFSSVFSLRNAKICSPWNGPVYRASAMLFAHIWSSIVFKLALIFLLVAVLFWMNEWMNYWWGSIVVELYVYCFSSWFSCELRKLIQTRIKYNKRFKISGLVTRKFRTL